MGQQPTPESTPQQGPSKPLRERLDQVKQAQRGVGVPLDSRAAKPALLREFHYFQTHPEATELPPEEHERLIRMDARENKSRALNKAFSTIGAEIEERFSEEDRSVLHGLGFDVGNEEGSLWEVRTPWTFDAETQIEIINQLRRLHMIPNIPGLGAQDLENTQEPISLHINFGFPYRLTDDEAYEVRNKYENDIATIIAALTIAYVSDRRLDSRKTKYAFTLTRTNTEATEKEIPLLPDPTKEPARLELRPFEVTDQLASDLLRNSQRLVAGLFAKIIMNNDIAFVTLSDNEQREVGFAASAFEDFIHEFSDLRAQHGDFPLRFMDAYDVVSPVSAADLVRDIDRVKAFRDLVKIHSAEIASKFGIPKEPAPFTTNPASPPAQE